MVTARGQDAGKVDRLAPAFRVDPAWPRPLPNRWIVGAVVGVAVDRQDRTNDRIQVFRKDGTFVSETVIARRTLGSGSVWDIGFSTDPAQTFLFVPDGTSQLVWVLRRDMLTLVTSFGAAGRWASQFCGTHSLAVDSTGSLFIAETHEGKRVQKFVCTGMAPAAPPLEP